MRKYIIAIITALAAGAIAVAGAYVQRGYWAVGAEYLVPIAVAATLLFMEGEEDEQN